MIKRLQAGNSQSITRKGIEGKILKAQEAYLKIDKFLEEKLDKYRINILSQIKNFNSEKIILIWMRLENYSHKCNDYQK